MCEKGPCSIELCVCRITNCKKSYLHAQNFSKYVYVYVCMRIYIYAGIKLNIISQLMSRRRDFITLRLHESFIYCDSPTFIQRTHTCIHLCIHVQHNSQLLVCLIDLFWVFAFIYKNNRKNKWSLVIRYQLLLLNALNIDSFSWLFIENITT